MSATFAIAWLCMRRWKWLPVGALLLGAFATYPSFNVEGPSTLQFAFTQFAWLAVLACFVPAVIAPTEPGTRPDYLFASPVPWWCVWLGRALAYALVGASTVLLVALPGWLATGELPRVLVRPRWEDFFAPFAVAGGIATAGYAAYRARRPVATATLAAGVLATVGTLYLAAQVAPYGPVLYWATMLAAAPLPVFSAVYLAAGRGEPVRAAVCGATAAVAAHVPAVLLLVAFTRGWLRL